MEDRYLGLYLAPGSRIAASQVINVHSTYASDLFLSPSPLYNHQGEHANETTIDFYGISAD
jgi:hypothetical protein